MRHPNAMKRLRTFTLVMLLAIAATLTGAVLTGFAASANPQSGEVQDITFAVLSVALFVGMLAKYFGPQHMHGNLRVSAISREWWVDYIVNALFPNNSFMLRSFSESDYVIGGKTVHLPQAGSHPGITVNRTVFPATAAERTDTVSDYNLDEYSSDPIRIRNAEQAELSYNKTESVLMTTMEQLRTALAGYAAYAWSTAVTANIVRTTGADSAENLVNGTATGTRKILTLADVRKARKILNKQNIAYEGRVLLLSSNMLDELMSDSTLLTRDNAQEVDLKNGTLHRLHGFDVMERSSTVTYTNASPPVKKTPAAAEAVTDNDSAIAYGPTYVARAVGDVEFFEALKDPLHYGDVYSSLVRAGFRQRRGDGAGVVNIVQAHGA